MKNIKKTLLLLCLILLSTTTVLATTKGATWPNLPSDPVKMQLGSGSPNSYLSVTLTEVPSGYSVLDGAIYAGWCGDVDLDQATDIYVNLYSTLSASLPASLDSIDWNAVNYIINHPGDFNRVQIQEAIWYITDDTGPSDAIKAFAQTALDASAAGYQPGPGDKLGVFCIPSDSNSAQPIIIELQPPATPTIRTELSQTTITIDTGCSHNYGCHFHYSYCHHSYSNCYSGYSNCYSGYSRCSTGSYNCPSTTDSVVDTAFVTGVSGLPTPTGTITFQVSKDNGVTWSNYGSVKTLVDGVATSDSYAITAVGTYYFRAIYSGDSIYVGVQSGNFEEPLVVTYELKTTTTTTCLSDDSITLGKSVYDVAYVTSGATGKVRFEVSTDGVNFVQYGELKTLSYSCYKNSATSDSYTPAATGTYYFRAVYLGDSTHSGSQSGNTDEVLKVTSCNWGCGSWGWGYNPCGYYNGGCGSYGWYGGWSGYSWCR
ncbi:MAG: Ig-like domain-containing protein [Candidatus Bathyarchaeota archaeon]|nr:Ig-like domain-containing protein [Candidatus Bathyarchaeota archaeon]